MNLEELTADDDVDFQDIKKIIDNKLAKFFFGCSIPYKVVEDEYFLDLVKALCNIKFQYKPPCRQTLATTFLHNLHDDMVIERKRVLHGRPCVMLVDGWKNKSNNKKNLVCTIRNINTPQTFLTCSDISLEKEDGQTLAAILSEAIKFAKEKYDADVFAIVTDNDSKIVCGARLTLDTHDQPLIQSTCSSHSGNLLIKSFVDNSFTECIRSICTTFRDPKLESLLLRQGGTKLKNYPDTRFCYVRDTSQSIIKNLVHLRNVALIEDVEINDRVFENLFNNEFKDRLSNMINVVTPICVLINECQDPQCNVADATQKWLSLQVPTTEYNIILQARIKKAVWPVGYAANLLHPIYQGILLNDNQREIAINFLRGFLNAEAVQEMELYLSDNEQFANLRNEYVSSTSFWSLCEIRFPNLAKFAFKLMLIPAATAVLESYFSNWAYVHNSHRNSLTNDNSIQ